MTTDLDIYRDVKDCLLEQNEQSTDISGECAYRGFTFIEDYVEPIQNLRCAIGHIIDDKYYWEGLEGKGPNDDQVLEAVRNSNPDWSMGEQSKDLICKLQVIHDILFPEEWPIVFDADNWLFDSDGNFIGVLNPIVDKFPTLLRSDAFKQKVYLNRNGLGSLTKEQIA